MYRSKSSFTETSRSFGVNGVGGGGSGFEEESDFGRVGSVIAFAILFGRTNGTATEAMNLERDTRGEGIDKGNTIVLWRRMRRVRRAIILRGKGSW